MLEETVIQQAAPTIAGLKAANLFPYSIEPTEDIVPQLAAWNGAFAAKGLRTIIIGRCPARPSRVLLYLYRPAFLDRILGQAAVRTFLLQYGYGSDLTAEECLALLSTRLCPEKPFPHEIGIFLGYPLADVIGFIKNKGKNYLSCGIWKVYSDREQAEKQFRQYRQCTQIFCKCYADGKRLHQLAVGV